MSDTLFRLWAAVRAALIVALALYDSGSPVAVWCTLLAVIVAADYPTGAAVVARNEDRAKAFERWRLAGQVMRLFAMLLATIAGAI